MVSAMTWFNGANTHVDRGHDKDLLSSALGLLPKKMDTLLTSSGSAPSAPIYPKSFRSSSHAKPEQGDFDIWIAQLLVVGQFGLEVLSDFASNAVDGTELQALHSLPANSIDWVVIALNAIALRSGSDGYRCEHIYRFLALMPKDIVVALPGRFVSNSFVLRCILVVIGIHDYRPVIGEADADVVWATAQLLRPDCGVAGPFWNWSRTMLRSPDQSPTTLFLRTLIAVGDFSDRIRGELAVIAAGIIRSSTSDQAVAIASHLRKLTFQGQKQLIATMIGVWRANPSSTIGRAIIDLVADLPGTAFTEPGAKFLDVVFGTAASIRGPLEGGDPFCKVFVTLFECRDFDFEPFASVMNRGQFDDLVAVM